MEEEEETMEEEQETMEEDSGAMEEISVEEEDIVEAREVVAMAAVTMAEIKEVLAREEAEEVLVKVVEEVGDREDLTWDPQPT